ncbi:MAG: hypothetical protein ACE5GV_10445 [Candidatus Scalindua sp.]
MNRSRIKKVSLTLLGCWVVAILMAGIGLWSSYVTNAQYIGDGYTGILFCHWLCSRIFQLPCEPWYVWFEEHKVVYFCFWIIVATVLAILWQWLGFLKGTIVALVLFVVEVVASWVILFTVMD